MTTTNSAEKPKQAADSSVYYSYVENFSALEEENKILKQTVTQLRTELLKFKANPLMICEAIEVHPDQTAVIRIPNGNSFLVNVSGEAGQIKAGDSVLVEQKNLTIIRRTGADKKFNVEQYVIIEKPQLQWSDVGGLASQINEIKEVIELPLKKPQLFKKIGIHPPKGVLLYGEPGTGKTLLAKAVAAATNSTFIEVVGSELVQKFIGEGAKLVHEMFLLAREKAPAIIFIDELDAIAATRIDVGTSGEREVQRTFMQLLAEIDGFDNLDNVKIIGCTNRKDILDPAIIRPGRLDRLIKVGIPDKIGRKEIFLIHSKQMNLKDVKVDAIVESMDNFSGAEIRATCTEAGYFAIRSNRTHITHEDLVSAVAKVKAEEKTEGDDYLRMFG